MQTHIQQTSLFAYREVKKTLGSRQKSVYEVLKKFGHMTNREIQKMLGWEINTITPRVKELRDMGLVRKWRIVQDETGRSAISWEVVPPVAMEIMKAIKEIKELE